MHKDDNYHMQPLTVVFTGIPNQMNCSKEPSLSPETQKKGLIDVIRTMCSGNQSHAFHGGPGRLRKGTENAE
jgi:hypothetical protein